VDKPQPKNKSSAVFVVGVFAAVAVLMFIAMIRSQNVQKIAVPLNNGMAALLRYNNFLGAVSNDNKIYIWEWSDLSKKPREGVVESAETVFVAQDTIVSVKRTSPDCVVVLGFDANSENKKIPLSLTSNTASLCANQDGSKVILLLERGDKDVTYELLEVLLKTGQVRPIAAIPSEQSKLGHFSVSDDGRYVVAVGEKKEHGWLFVVDTKDRKIIWQKELPDLRKLYKGVFSNDGAVIYIRGNDSMLTLVKTSSGEIVDRWLPTKENKDIYRMQQTQTVVISNDGGLVAAVVGNDIFVWDAKTRKKYDVTKTGQKIISSIVFSPDAKFIATSDMRQGGDIKVIPSPRH
jgi:WD40 repeat protein